jgi:hypothetical protein
MSRTLARSTWIARSATLVATGLVAGSIVVGVSSASSRSARGATASIPQPPQTVTASPITAQPGTVRAGTKVSSRNLSERVFLDNQHGFALGAVGQAQYPATTVDGGKTWRTDGPALHVNAAQAPLAVSQIGVLNRHTYFAFGSQVVDVTNDLGKHWWRAFLGDLVMAVVPGGQGQLVAFAQASLPGRGPGAVNWQYVSKDGGRHWHYDVNLGGF